MVVSKIIHFIWFNKYDVENPDVTLPVKYQKNVEAWKRMYPDWQIHVHTHYSVIMWLIAMASKEIWNTFLNYKNFICKVDLAKFILLYVYGGLYMDLDIYPTQANALNTVPFKSITLIKEPYENCKNYNGFGPDLMMDKFVISNAWIYSEGKQNPNLLKILTYYMAAAPRESIHILAATGPPVLNQYYIQNKSADIALLEPTGILTKNSSPLGMNISFTSFDNTWCTSLIWNDAVFDSFYFYPTLNTKKYPFRTVPDLKSYIQQLIIPGCLAFDTTGQLKVSVPSLMGLDREFDTEFEGIFIRKSFFKTREKHIPAKIHQIWIGPRKPPHSFTDTWSTINPHFEYKLWNEEELQKEFPEVFEHYIYKQTTNYYVKVDLLRLHVLNKYGGIYIDCDCKALKPLTDEFLHHKFFATFESEINRGMLVNNCIVGSKPNSEVINKMLLAFDDYHDDTVKELEGIYLTSPGFYTNFIQKHPELDVFIYPSYYFKKDNDEQARENTYLSTRSYADHVGRYDPSYLAEFINYGENISKKEDLGHIYNQVLQTGFGAEIGVLRGENAREILKRWRGSLLYLVDPWESQDKEVYVDMNNSDNPIHNMNYDLCKINTREYTDRVKMVKNYSEEASKQIPDESLDFIYIDARHDYDGVLQDLECWYPKVRSGGVISGDDIVFEEHREHAEKYGKFAVDKALQDYISKYNLNVNLSILPHARGQDGKIGGSVFRSWYFIKK